MKSLYSVASSKENFNPNACSIDVNIKTKKLGDTNYKIVKEEPLERNVSLTTIDQQV